MSYKTIHEFGSDEIEIDKSRFIGYAKPIKTEQEANRFIETIRKKHKDANHNVWAYTLGQGMNIQRYSDDGEPQGTAAIPVLEVIKKEDLRNLVIVVTRYFGGIKLGAGGLVRAYTKGAKIALLDAKIVNKVLYEELNIIFNYTLLGKIQNEIIKLGYFIKNINYEDKVDILVYSRKNEVDDLKERLVEVTNNQLEIIGGEEFYLSENNDGLLL